MNDHAQAPAQTVLVVDDEAVIRNGISRSLKARGMEVKSAGSGREALDLLHRLKDP